ncbi:MAG: hypothetical protein EOP85_23195, partial [Verrucomicrobiaceae bacterium]
MLPVTSSLSADTSVRDTILRKAEAALPAAVRERCHAEAEAVAEFIPSGLGFRMAAFTDGCGQCGLGFSENGVA